MHQSSVGDSSVVEVERLQLGQPLEMHLRSVGDFGAPEALYHLIATKEASQNSTEKMHLFN